MASSMYQVLAEPVDRDQLPVVEDRTTVRVLLVDDQPIVAESIRRLVSSEVDIQLSYCRDPQDAIPKTLEFKPTVILQDLFMPDIDGLTIVKFLRAHPQTHSIPIVVLSSKDDPNVKAEAFSTGANDYLIKIPDPIELIARLRYHSTAYTNLLKCHEAEQALALQNQQLEAEVSTRTAELVEALNSLKHTQAQLIHDEKMTSLGQLMAGIAHEINNPVSFISGNVAHALEYAEDLLGLIHLYRQEYPQPTAAIQEKLDDLDIDFVCKDFADLLNSLQTGTNRVKNIVTSLKSFSYMGRQGMQSVDIHHGIEDTLTILNSKLRSVNVVRDYGNCPPVDCLPGQLNQVFMNILVNAIDATQEKVKWSENKQNYQPEIEIVTRNIDDEWISVTIRDNGLGVPEEVREHIFDPFFTTKEIGKGTGLGLSISWQIVVERHGGQIEVSSKDGEGTTFLIKIPISSQVSEHSAIADNCFSMAGISG